MSISWFTISFYWRKVICIYIYDIAIAELLKEWAKERVCFHSCTLVAISNRKSSWTVTKCQIGELSVQGYSLLGQTEGERKAFLGGSKKGDHIVRLPPSALGCVIRDEKVSCKIWNNPTPPLFFIRRPYK